MATRTNRGSDSKSCAELLEGDDVSHSTDISIDIPDTGSDSNPNDPCRIRARDLGSNEQEITREDAFEDKVATSKPQPAGTQEGVTSRNKQQVTLPTRPGKSFEPLTREKIYFDRMNKVAFGEIWDRITAMPGFDEMTDEQALELALQTQREERRAHKQGR